MDRTLDVLAPSAPAARAAGIHVRRAARSRLRRVVRLRHSIGVAAVSTTSVSGAMAQQTVSVAYPAVDFREGYNAGDGRHEYRSSWMERVVFDAPARPIEAWVGGQFLGDSVQVALEFAGEGRPRDCGAITVRVPPAGVTAIRWTLLGPDPVTGRRAVLKADTRQIKEFVYQQQPGIRCTPKSRPLALTNDQIYYFDTLSTASRTTLPPDYTIRAEALNAQERVLLRAESGPVVIPRRAPLVVSVGDSYASGEGVPDTVGRADPVSPRGEYLCRHLTTFAAAIRERPKMESYPQWLDWTYHRSLRSAPALAALSLAREVPFLTFLSFAKSGATLVGWDEEAPDEWTENMRRYLDSLGLGPDSTRADDALRQLEEVKRTVGDHRIDALLISIGGNDVGFGNTLVNLTRHHRGILVGERIATRERRIRQKIAHLDTAGYPRVNRQIRALGLNVGAVLITEYPGSLFTDRRDIPAEGCGVFKTSVASPVKPEFFSIDSVESALLSRLGLALDSAIARAARREGWRLVDGIDEAYRGHGYCSGRSWFVFAEDSCVQQGDWQGTMHPTAAGNEAAARLIARELRRVLPRRTPGGVAAPGAGPVARPQ